MLKVELGWVAWKNENDCWFAGARLWLGKSEGFAAVW